MKHIVSRMSSYFPNRWPLSYLNLTKNMKTYIRRQQHKKKLTPRHKTTRTTTEVSIQTKHKVITMVIIKMFIPNQKLRKSLILFCDFFSCDFFFPTQISDFFRDFLSCDFFPTFVHELSMITCAVCTVVNGVYFGFSEQNSLSAPACPPFFAYHVSVTLTAPDKSFATSLAPIIMVSNMTFFFNSVLRPFQDYFSSYETGQSVGGRKRENPEKKHLAHPQTELVTSAGLEPTPDTAVR